MKVQYTHSDIYAFMSVYVCVCYILYVYQSIYLHMDTVILPVPYK